MTIQYERFCNAAADTPPKVRTFARTACTGLAVWVLLSAGDVLAEDEIDRLLREPHPFSERDQLKAAEAHGLAKIKKSLGVSMSDFALLLAVSRPTAYAWVEGKQTPNPEKFRAIERVIELEQKFSQSPFARLDLWLKRPVFAGRTFIEVFSAGEPYEEQLAIIRERAISESETRTKLKGLGSSNDRNSLSHFFPPLSRE